MNRRELMHRALACGISTATLPSWAYASVPLPKPEKTELTLGVGGASLLYYLPLSIAERCGFFEQEGLRVTVNDFGAGSVALQALIGDNVDAVAGAYEHTLRMQQKGIDVKAVCELDRFPGICIGVRSDLGDRIKSIADLKGLNIGVTAPGSSTAMVLQYALIRAGLTPDAASLIAVGGGASAVAAIKNREIDAISHVEPVISRLQADGDITLLLDGRTEQGTQALFGSASPAGTVYLKREFIDTYPATTQRLVNAFFKALQWIQQASAKDVAKTVPEAYLLGDAQLYQRAFEASKPMYSTTGIIGTNAFRGLLEMLRKVDPSLAKAQISYAQTFDSTFVKKRQTL
ncbi:ABC transporter substrate-binding protein [Brucella pituitosa]|uniref:ABC transporter substrate-binding protein n=1 Tax=Brucella pituitosa TaxID=571256 RepID=UPI0009A1F0B6|nr:ABC transporter substrate-binding protein [Brucella pituitosa]